MYIYCSLCYEQACPHFTVERRTNEFFERDFFHLTCQNLKNLNKNLKNNKPCNGTIEIYPRNSQDGIHKETCPSCQTTSIVSEKALSIQEIHDVTGNRYYPSDKCLACKGKECLTIQTFKSCQPCAGTGQKCNLCNDVGSYLIKDKKDWKERVCLCKRGFPEVCFTCKGEGVVADKELTIKCNEHLIEE
jgi:hypothetical protein